MKRTIRNQQLLSVSRFECEEDEDDEECVAQLLADLNSS